METTLKITEKEFKRKMREIKMYMAESLVDLMEL